MLLAAQKYKCVKRAIKLAALLAVGSDLFIYGIKEVDYGELASASGDHITLLKIYEKWEDVLNSPQGNSYDIDYWCEDLGIHWEMLIEAQRIANLIYMRIGKTLLLGSDDEGTDEQVVKALVSGYFMNITYFLNERNQMDGSFILTPVLFVQDGEDGKGSKEMEKETVIKRLIDVKMLKESVLAQQTDPIKLGVFHKLVKRGRTVFMQIVTRIDPNWVLECAPEVWRESVNFRILDDGSVRTIVEERVISGVGELVLWKLSDSKHEGIKGMIGKETETKIVVNFIKGTIICSGLGPNVEIAKNRLQSFVRKTQRDASSSYYSKKIQFFDADVRTKWDDVEETTVILFSIPKTHQDNLQKILHSIPTNHLLFSNKNPETFAKNVTNNGGNSFISCKSLKSAEEVKHFISSNFVDHRNHIKLDRNVKIEIKGVSASTILPDLHKIADSLGMKLLNKTNFTSFQYNSKTTKHKGGSDNIPCDKIERLEEVLQIQQLSLPDTYFLYDSNSLLCNEVQVYRCIDSMLRKLENHLKEEKEENVQMTFDKTHFRFEISGLKQSRSAAFELANEALTQANTQILTVSIVNPPQFMIQSIMKKLATLRKAHASVAIWIQIKCKKVPKTFGSLYPMPSIIHLKCLEEDLSLIHI